MIVIVDYKMGNIASIRNMLRKVGGESIITSDPDQIASAQKLILPGVGAFDAGMTHISQMGLLEPLNHAATVRKAPVLGICLGMQLLTASSEEGSLGGLGWIDGRTIRFQPSRMAAGLKIPHMGWNSVQVKDSSSLFRNLDDEAAFYFVHSYHVVCGDEFVLATAHHGYDFVCAVRKGNVFGTQFHPEKSHRYGMQVLRNFAELDVC
mgnify:CR=1 FL=1|jgi:glutamine amidotransferase